MPNLYKFFMNSKFSSISRYIIVGSISSIVYLIVLSLSVELLYVSSTTGVIIAYTVGMIVSYSGNAIYAFDSQLSAMSSFRFVIVTGASFLINVGIAKTMEAYDVHYIFIGLVIISIVPLFNYFWHKTWTFQ